MFGKVITINPGTPNFKLPTIFGGQGSAGQVIIQGVPSGFTAMFVFQPKSMDDAQLIIADSENTVTIGGWNFPEVEQIEYEIVIKKDSTTVSCGHGFITIYASYTSAELPTPPPVTIPITMVPDPLTGLYYPVYVTTNALGQVTTSVGQIPIDPLTGEEVENA